MPDASELSEAKRALLEKYLRGELPQAATGGSTIAQRVQKHAASPSAHDSRASLVPIQIGGSKRPFFYTHVHWIGGAFYCFTLAHDLGADQPFYVLNPYRFDGMKAPPTIEAIAAAYIELMRTVQPEGPYLLGGFCGGGLMAYEIAQQLRAEGQAVDLLVLVDPMAGSIQLVRLLGAIIRRIGSLIRLGQDKQLDWFLRVRYVSRLLRRARDEYTEHVDRLLRRWQDENPRRSSLIPAAEALRQDWMGIFIWAISEYIPHQYPGKITYFFARENPDGRRLWWGEVAETENVEIQVIPGTHETCRTEHLHEMAEELRACISKAQRTH